MAPRRAGQLSLTAHAVRDGSFGRRLLTNTGLNCVLTKIVTARIARFVATAVLEICMTSGQETHQEKSYPRSRVPEEGEARLEGRGKQSSTARAVRDGSFGRCLLTNAGQNRALMKTVTALILR